MSDMLTCHHFREVPSIAPCGGRHGDTFLKQAKSMSIGLHASGFKIIYSNSEGAKHEEKNALA